MLGIDFSFYKMVNIEDGAISFADESHRNNVGNKYSTFLVVSDPKAY